MQPIMEIITSSETCRSFIDALRRSISEVRNEAAILTRRDHDSL